MNSVLVALIVHLLGNTASLEAGRVPFYVVPQQLLAADGAPLKLTTRETFGEPERQRWQALMTMSGSVRNAAELCYRAAYADIAKGVSRMPEAEKDRLLVEVGGHHALAIAGVRWCNASLRKMDIVPLKHPEFGVAEKSVRQLGYEADVAYVAACADEACKKRAMTSFGTKLIAVPLEAVR